VSNVPKQMVKCMEENARVNKCHKEVNVVIVVTSKLEWFKASVVRDVPKLLVNMEENARKNDFDSKSYM